MLSAMLFSLAIAQGSPSQGTSAATSSCPPDSEVAIATLVQPGSASLADATKLTGPVVGMVEVHVDRSGALSSGAIYKSTGNVQLDQALLWAARRTTYSPKISNCHAVIGTYIYRLDFKPYNGDIAKTTARFTDFFNALLSTKRPPQDPTVALDPNITSAQSLYVFSLYFSTLGAFHGLNFLSDDFVQGVHRFHYRASFDKGSSVVMFITGNNDQLIGFVNEG